MPMVRESFACFVIKTEKYANVKGVTEKETKVLGEAHHEQVFGAGTHWEKMMIKITGYIVHDAL